jgi:3-hydroxybutyryl-CoA dehydrogenase
MENTGRIAVIGAGFMGTVVSSLYARYGYEVFVHDSQSTILDTCLKRARPIAVGLSNEQTPVEAILGRIHEKSTLSDAIEGAFLVHENIQEVLALKQNLFASLDQMCKPDVILATNTASFLLSDVCRDVTEKERVIGIHYITPAHVVRAVELVYADFTPKALVEWSRRFLSTIDHVGIACRERPGFLINRMQFALLSEVYRIVEEGWATRDDVDAAFRLSLGPRLALWGPLLTEDLVVNKKNALAVTESLHEATGDSNYAGRPILRDLIEKGKLGAIAGQGWYDFGASYDVVIEKRDAQLRSLLDWLRINDPTGNIGIIHGGSV